MCIKIVIRYNTPSQQKRCNKSTFLLQQKKLRCNKSNTWLQDTHRATKFEKTSCNGIEHFIQQLRKCVATIRRNACNKPTDGGGRTGGDYGRARQRRRRLSQFIVSALTTLSLTLSLAIRYPSSYGHLPLFCMTIWGRCAALRLPFYVI